MKKKILSIIKKFKLVFKQLKIKTNNSISYLNDKRPSLSTIYIVYEIKQGNHVILRWFLTEYGAKKFTARFSDVGNNNFCVRDLSWSGKTRVNNYHAYLDMIIRKGSGDRQKIVLEGMEYEQAYTI